MAIKSAAFVTLMQSQFNEEVESRPVMNSSVVFPWLRNQGEQDGVWGASRGEKLPNLQSRHSTESHGWPLLPVVEGRCLPGGIVVIPPPGSSCLDVGCRRSRRPARNCTYHHKQSPCHALLRLRAGSLMVCSFPSCHADQPYQHLAIIGTVQGILYFPRTLWNKHCCFCCGCWVSHDDYLTFGPTHNALDTRQACFNLCARTCGQLCDWSGWVRGDHRFGLKWSLKKWNEMRRCTHLGRGHWRVASSDWRLPWSSGLLIHLIQLGSRWPSCAFMILIKMQIFVCN